MKYNIDKNFVGLEKLMYALRLIKQNKHFWYDRKDRLELFRLKILYIHGLSSSGSSSTAQRIRTLLPQAIVYSPDLPIEPDEAVALLRKIADQEHVDIVIGTSMGGMFAQKLRGYPKIMVNPSFHVSRTMRRRIGMNPFFSERENGEKEYEITEELCERYEALEREQFKNLTEKEIQLSVGLFGTQDDTVNCLNEYRQHYRSFKTFKGGHRLTEENIRQVILPLIKEMTPDYLW